MQNKKRKSISTSRPAATAMTIVSRRPTPEERREQDKALDFLLTELVRQQQGQKT